MFWPLLESNNTYNNEKKWFRDALWTDTLASITQATMCYYPVLLHLENRDSLTGIIRKHFFYIIASATLKDSFSFLKIYPSCIGQENNGNLKT